MLFGLRHHYCPHCFEITIHPSTWLKVLCWPLVMIGRILRWIFIGA